MSGALKKMDESLELCLSVACGPEDDLSSDFRFVRYIFELRQAGIFSWSDFAEAVDKNRMPLYANTQDMSDAVRALRMVAMDAQMLEKVRAAIKDDRNGWDDLMRIARGEIEKAKSALANHGDKHGEDHGKHLHALLRQLRHRI